jgi:hypothetical protein
MGALLGNRLAANLTAAGIDPTSVSVNSLLSPLPQNGAAAVAEEGLRIALGGAIQSVFLIALGAAALGLLVTSLAPNKRLSVKGAPAAAQGD